MSCRVTLPKITKKYFLNFMELSLRNKMKNLSSPFYLIKLQWQTLAVAFKLQSYLIWETCFALCSFKEVTQLNSLLVLNCWQYFHCFLSTQDCLFNFSVFCFPSPYLLFTFFVFSPLVWLLHCKYTNVFIILEVAFISSSFITCTILYFLHSVVSSSLKLRYKYIYLICMVYFHHLVCLFKYFCFLLQQ